MNGIPTKDVKGSRGLRQWDFLSPFLFTITFEGLAGLVKKASYLGYFKGLKVYERMEYQILLFTDGIVFVEELFEKLMEHQSIYKRF